MITQVTLNLSKYSNFNLSYSEEIARGISNKTLLEKRPLIFFQHLYYLGELSLSRSCNFLSFPIKYIIKEEI